MLFAVAEVADAAFLCIAWVEVFLKRFQNQAFRPESNSANLYRVP